MPVISVYDQAKKKMGDLNLDDRVFKVPFRSHLIYDAVIAHRVNKRQGTSSTKTRAEVRGGGIKPFRQKGTGRARQGSTRSILQVGGGVAFGPHPRDYCDRLSKKTLKGALKTVLSQLCAEKRIHVLKDLKMEQIQTKKLLSILKKFSMEKGLIVDDENNHLQKSSANLRSFKYLKPEGLNVYDLIKFQYLFVTEAALLKIEKRLQS